MTLLHLPSSEPALAVCFRPGAIEITRLLDGKATTETAAALDPEAALRLAPQHWVDESAAPRTP